MKNRRLLPGFVLICLGMAILSCSKDDPDSEFNFDNCPNPSSVDPGIIKQEIVSYDNSFNVLIPRTKVFSWKTEKFDVEINTPQEIHNNLVDLHIEVLPLYVFGTDEPSGDYYSVTGYVVVHNASCMKQEKIYTEDGSSVEKIGWYMGDLCVDAQLLDSNGAAVTNENVSFLVTPEPSTTIGETTYTKGFSFSLSPALTFGKTRKTTEEGDPAWKTTGLGAVSFGFSWNNSSTQVLPDQTVMMWTGPEDRSVSYDLKTNNLKEDATIEAIPAIARNDQRFDFSWVWKVKSGAYEAKDYSFGNMKMKLSITPKFDVNVFGYCYVKWKEVDDKGKEVEKEARMSATNYFIGSNVDPLEYEIDLPAMNRIPTAKFNLKNCTRSYLSNLEIYREGEYGEKAAYTSQYCVCAQNESVNCMLREGTYDIIYELFNGDTGESRGKFKIAGVKFSANDDLSLTTFDGESIDD